MKTHWIIGLVLMAFSTQVFASETRVYLLGDVDNFQYGGSGSIDNVYVDADLITWLQNVAPGEPAVIPYYLPRFL